MIKTSGYIAKAQGVLTAADKVHGVGHAAVVAGHHHGGDLAVGPAFGKNIDVEQELLGTVLGALKPDVNRVLLAFAVPRLVPISVHFNGQRGLVGVKSSRHFGKQLLGQALQGRHLMLPIGIFCRQIL